MRLPVSVFTHRMCGPLVRAEHPVVGEIDVVLATRKRATRIVDDHDLLQSVPCELSHEAIHGNGFCSERHSDGSKRSSAPPRANPCPAK